MNVSSFPAKNFKNWLLHRGAEIYEPTTDWEYIRFRCNKGYGVSYRNKKGALKFNEVFQKAFNAFRANKPWNGFVEDIHAKGRPPTKKRALVFRDGHACFFCMKEFGYEELTIEHLVPKCHGGGNHMSNLVLACSPCNSEVDIMPVTEKIRHRERHLLLNLTK